MAKTRWKQWLLSRVKMNRCSKNEICVNVSQGTSNWCANFGVIGVGFVYVVVLWRGRVSCLCGWHHFMSAVCFAYFKSLIIWPEAGEVPWMSALLMNIFCLVFHVLWPCVVLSPPWLTSRYDAAGVCKIFAAVFFCFLRTLHKLAYILFLILYFVLSRRLNHTGNCWSCCHIECTVYGVVSTFLLLLCYFIHPE